MAWSMYGRDKKCMCEQILVGYHKGMRFKFIYKDNVEMDHKDIRYKDVN
jgi:hypothetical protein